MSERMAAHSHPLPGCNEKRVGRVNLQMTSLKRKSFRFLAYRFDIVVVREQLLVPQGETFITRQFFVALLLLSPEALTVITLKKYF